MIYAGICPSLALTRTLCLPQLHMSYPYYFLSLRSILTTQIAVNDIGSAADFLAAIEGT
ncbi:MAG: hypothetical protein RL466_953, partial [Actinomycetota bacterium]